MSKQEHSPRAQSDDKYLYSTKESAAHRYIVGDAEVVREGALIRFSVTPRNGTNKVAAKTTKEHHLTP